MRRQCTNGAASIIEGKVQKWEEDGQRLNSGGSNICLRRCDRRNIGGREMMVYRMEREAEKVGILKAQKRRN